MVAVIQRHRLRRLQNYTFKLCIVATQYLRSSTVGICRLQNPAVKIFVTVSQTARHSFLIFNLPFDTTLIYN